MESPLSWTLNNANHHLIIVLICTDSKSLCDALISSHPRTSSILNFINSILSSVFIQWIPGHSAIPGNDLADKAAKEATSIATDTILPISLALFKSLTRQFVTLHQHTNGLLLSTNIDGLLGMQNRSTTEEMTS